MVKKIRIILFLIIAFLLPATVFAVPPVVKTVPWVATDLLAPHDTWSGKQITLKGTSDSQGANFQYTWDFGDGSVVTSGTVTDKYVIEARHTYSGAAGTVFTARLTVQNTSTGESASKEYYVAMRDKSLSVEVNVAIDEGLWYLHKSQTRLTSGGIDYGHWETWKNGGYATYGEPSVTASNVNAFEVNGHLESGNPANPYVETVARGLKRIFTYLGSDPTVSQTNPFGTFSTDGNGNGIRLHTSAQRYYQGGMLMDAIVASGTPTAVTTTGGVNVLGKTYKDIVQDMVDEYAWAQYDGGTINPPYGGGGWRYNGNEWPDNSACQWAAIGLIAATRQWGCVLNPIVKDWNVVWLAYSQNPSTGVFGYTDQNPIWGPYATTPSGLVQMAMDGIGRGATGPNGKPSWDKAETYIRDNWGIGSGYYYNIKDYYYGLFSFVKAMLLHDADGDGIAEPIQYLHSQTPGVSPIDWYASEGSNPAAADSMDGVARTLVNDQAMGTPYWGYWWEHNATGTQYYFETAQAIMMLSRTIFESGSPVAVAKAVPNPAVLGQTIILDGSASFHQDPAKNIDSWEWDLDDDGVFDVTGPTASVTFAALGTYPIKLRVTDNGSPEDSTETIINVLVTTPPVAPTAMAKGPYTFCPQTQPWFLDGTGSINPDEGQHQPGAYPGDTIQSYAWDLDGSLQFIDAFGPQPDVTAFFTAKGPGSYLVQLKVTDTTATSFPSSGYGDLSDTDSTVVYVYASTDPACSCVNNLTARAKSGKIQLVWTHTGAASYNIYRGTTNGGPYLFIANTTSTYSTYLDANVVNGTTYYYVVREAALNGNELCQSNQASAKPTTR